MLCGPLSDVGSSVNRVGHEPPTSPLAAQDGSVAMTRLAHGAAARQQPRLSVTDWDDRAVPVPKYRGLVTALRARAEAVAVGTSMPSERQLAEETGVSRMTARRAIDELVRDGLLVRHVGRGTFVARPLVSVPLQLTGFTDDITARGSRPASRVLRAEIAPADGSTAQALRIHEGDDVIHLARVRLADGLAIAIERSHLPAGRFPGLLDHDYATESLYRVLGEEHRVRFDSGSQVIRASLASAPDASTLDIRVGAPVLELVRTSVSQGEVVEWTTSTYPGDRFELSAAIAPVTAPGSERRSALRARD